MLIFHVAHDANKRKGEMCHLIRIKRIATIDDENFMIAMDPDTSVSS